MSYKVTSFDHFLQLCVKIEVEDYSFSNFLIFVPTIVAFYEIEDAFLNKLFDLR